LVSRDTDHVTALDHEYYTCRQKKFGIMEPNMKLLIEDLMKRVQEEIKEGFINHTVAINKWFTEFQEEEQKRDECVAALETAAAAFHNTSSTWKPEVESSINSVCLELAKLNTFFDHEVKELNANKPGILKLRSVLEQPTSASPADGPNDHRVENQHRDCGLGCVYTFTHDPVKGTVHSPQFLSRTNYTPELHAPRDPFASSFGQTSRNAIGKLPKVNFPKFEGENPKLWQSRCENYLDMYEVDPNFWVKVAAMHFKGPAARWLQSIDHRVHKTNWSELCSWIHDRFGWDQHELLIRQLYIIKQEGTV
jgi:hypothetical protein